MQRQALTNSEQDEVLASQLVAAYTDHTQFEAKALTEDDLRDILVGCGILDNHIVATFFHMLQLKEAQRKKGGGKGKKAGKEAGKEDVELADTISFETFFEVAVMLTKGEEAKKVEFIFDFVDITCRGLIDKYEMSTAVRHLLWCQTNWYGEEILYDGAFDHDLFFEVPTESIAQLKANKFAHEMIMHIPGASRNQGLSKKQFGQFMLKGGKEVKFLKGLFSVLGAYPPPEFASHDE